MISIEQLLESVDLNFEPRWVTRDECGEICIFEHKPETYESTREWVATVPACGLSSIGKIKLAEFANKHWTECIYEVPRKTTGKIEKVEGYTTDKILAKVNELVDAVNELKSCTKNVQPPYVRLYTCSDGAVFDNEDIAKSHEASLKNMPSMN